MASPGSLSNGPSPSGSRIGRPPQWTVSRSRKLARLYLFSTLSIEKIIKVLEEDGFSPKKNSAQKTIHKMLDNDPRYLRPESRLEMSKRISSLYNSPTRHRRKLRSGNLPRGIQRVAPLQRAPAHDVRSKATFDLTNSPEHIPNTTIFSTPCKDQGETSIDSVESVDDYVATVRDIKRRVSDCSSQFALQISTLIKEFTISEPSDDERSIGRRLSTVESVLFDEDDVADSNFTPNAEVNNAFPEPAFSLPGDFLSAHTRSCADFPGQQVEHDAGRCWCAIAKETADEPDSWLLPGGGLSSRAKLVVEHPSPANTRLCDNFGNTVLHLLSALEGYEETLLRILACCDQVVLRAVNTGRQNFLHVLHSKWFMGLATPTAPLRRLLAFIREVCPEIVHQTDVYGRTFIHRAYSIVRNREPLAALLVPFNTHLSSRRDAFGFNPLSQNKAESVFLPPRRAGGFQVSTQREELGPFRSTSRPPSSSEDDSFVAYHARLVEVIWSSYNNPRIEDSEGRNGLHCLAEAIINPQTMDRHMQRPNLKRKLSTKDITVSTSPPTTASTSSQRPPPSSSNPGPTITTPIPFTAATADEGTLSTRLRHLHSLLDPTVGVDPTHYDRFGTTPLMAFVEHIPDHHDDKAKTLQTLLETLVGRSTLGFPSPNMNNTSDTSSHPAAPGPSPILEARNRRGETALLVAARLGRKVALATLLELGANVGVRDVEGRGVLEVIDDEIGSARARADVCLYARLEACRALLTGRREWGVRYQRGRGVEGSVGLVQGGSVEGADRGAGVCEEWRVRV